MLLIHDDELAAHFSSPFIAWHAHAPAASPDDEMLYSAFTASTFALLREACVTLQPYPMADELRSRCAKLQEERDGLAAEKAELVVELSRQAGHLNHKQKIHYVAKLKQEVDELKTALKEAQQLKDATRARPTDGKENGAPACAPQPKTQTRAPARNATAAV